jgi:hypothetical protein
MFYNNKKVNRLEYGNENLRHQVLIWRWWYRVCIYKYTTIVLYISRIVCGARESWKRGVGLYEKPLSAAPSLPTVPYPLLLCLAVHRERCTHIIYKTNSDRWITDATFILPIPWPLDQFTCYFKISRIFNILYHVIVLHQNFYQRMINVNATCKMFSDLILLKRIIIKINKRNLYLKHIYQDLHSFEMRQENCQKCARWQERYENV